MPYREVFTCAGCGKEKGEVNHWWAVCIEGQFSFAIRPWGESLGRNIDFESYCGQECLTKALSEWMHKINPNVVVPK